MPRQRRIVTYQPIDPTRIPDLLVPSALLLSDLEERGVVDALADRIRIRRQGGFAGIDVFLLLLVFLGSSAHGGIRPFWQLLGPVVKRIAALAKRSKLPSPSATSRALARVETDLIRPHTSWLLTEAPQVDHVLKHPSVFHFDANGCGWHVFDLDPTVTTLRQRALPLDSDLPEPERRADNAGKPGYSGRKRGDIQYRRVDIHHAGAGLFVHTHLHTGNGDGTADVALGVRSIVALRDRMGWSPERVLLRADGEFGTVPYFHLFRKHSIPFITRAKYPSLYDNPNVLDCLRAATWTPVPDSGSGPQRVAADVGVVELRASRKTLKDDGSPYEPIRVRVVASIFERDKDAQRGRKMDGRQVEFFVADVSANAWPAADVAAAYYGRASQENRFAQEDREVGLARIVSYDLPGQELATLAGLFLLNYRIARGFDLEPPPVTLPQPVLRTPVVDKSVLVDWPRDPVIARNLRKLDWDDILGSRVDWTWEPVRGELRCPEGRLLELTTVRPASPDATRTSIIFRRPCYGCGDCESRSACFASKNPDAHKHLELTIDMDVAKPLRKRLERLRSRPDVARGVVPEPIHEMAGLHAVLSPRFKPREARKVFEELFVGASMRVVVDNPAIQRPRLRLVATDDADRQGRRQTWTQRVARYALAEHAVVGLEIETDRKMWRWLGGGMARETEGKAAS